jgi:SH3-like domain-containing protein
MHKILLNFFIFTIFFITNTAIANPQELPRFATIKSNHVNARKGPGTTYPIEWVFIRKGEPIKIIAEFEQWRKVEDLDNQGGWVHSSVLSPKRSIIITSTTIQKMMNNSNHESRIIARLEPGLRCSLDQCKNHWCKIKCDGYKGWVESVAIWGILPTEAEEL